jgi:preprotein translocase subunit YajC
MVELSSPEHVQLYRKAVRVPKADTADSSVFIFFSFIIIHYFISIRTRFKNQSEMLRLHYILKGKDTILLFAFY